MASQREKIYKIHKLDGSPYDADFKRIGELWKQNTTQDLVSRANGAYLPWDEFRKKNWSGDDREVFWRLIQSTRLLARRPTPIADVDGGTYAFDPHRHVEFLHQIDLEFGGNMLGIADFGEAGRRQIIRRNLIEESIASSRLEGANTSRQAARKMLTEGRKPRDKSERMIVNNHHAMRRIEEELKNQPLTLDLLLDLHQQVTHGTLDDPSLEGILRETLDKHGNRLKIMPWDDFTVVYVAPDKDFVAEQLPRLIAFANDEDKSGFIHPLFKATMLHFWIGLLHPFEDGNGRLARILFYWYMLRKGYWAFSYLSLSERILKSPRQYAMAFIYAEQDGRDLNYFIQYNVEKLVLARQHLQEHLRETIAENRLQSRVLNSGHGLNQRQIRLLQYLSKDEERSTNVASYHHINDAVGYVTAVTDLKKLTQLGLLRKLRAGRNINYFPTGRVKLLFK